MADDEEMTSAAAGRDGLATQLRALEDFVARSEAEGEALPPEAREMVLRLRQLVQALDGLTASIAESEQRAPSGPTSSPDAP